MNSPPPSSKHRIGPGIAVAAGLLAIAVMTLIFIFDSQLKAKSAWLPYLFAAPIYVLFQVFAEGVLEGFWSSKRWLVKAFPVVAIITYYLLWFAFVL